MTVHVAPTVLFACVSNTGKSVMAQGIMRHAPRGAHSRTVGWNPRHDLGEHQFCAGSG